MRTPFRVSRIWLMLDQLYGCSCGGNGYFAIWLKSEGYSVVDRNIMPTGTSLISAACVVLWGFLSDYTGSRYIWLLIPMVSVNWPRPSLMSSLVGMITLY